MAVDLAGDLASEHHHPALAAAYGAGVPSPGSRAALEAVVTIAPRPRWIMPGSKLLMVCKMAVRVPSTVECQSSSGPRRPARVVPARSRRKRPGPRPGRAAARPAGAAARPRPHRCSHQPSRWPGRRRCARVPAMAWILAWSRPLTATLAPLRPAASQWPRRSHRSRRSPLRPCRPRSG